MLSCLVLCLHGIMARNKITVTIVVVVAIAVTVMTLRKCSVISYSCIMGHDFRVMNKHNLWIG